MRCSMRLGRKVCNRATCGNCASIPAAKQASFANLFDNGFEPL
jgi:hypothetical protein